MIRQDQLKALLHYSSGTGVFTWRVTGKSAGYEDRRGYVSIKIAQVQYRAHRLAWLYMTGSWPNEGLDHKDRNPRNNAFSNLREATLSQNLANRRRRRDRQHDLPKGVSMKKKLYRSDICVGGKPHYLGLFNTPEEAHAAYAAAAREAFGEFASLD